jgi:hypothetical protein
MAEFWLTSAPAPRLAPLRAAPQTIFAVAKKAPAHPAYRFTVPGAGMGPKLRAPNTPYRPTGFTAVTRSTTAGASFLPHRVLRSAAPLPKEFSFHPQDLVSATDQGQCGTCWAFSALSMLADRVSVATHGSVRTELSERQLQECAWYSPDNVPGGCNGNDPYAVLKDVVGKQKRFEAVGAYPRQYTGAAVDAKACTVPSTSQGFSVGASSAFIISEPISKPGDAANLRNVENMKSHIFNEGPIQATFTVMDDFSNYDGLTIYEPQSTTATGGHAIEIIGWGVDATSGVQFWVCRNSWGTAWPASHKPCAGQGFFYFRMGTNVCNIEQYACGLIPVVYNGNESPAGKSGLYPGEKACETDTPVWTPNYDLLTTHSYKSVIVGVGTVMFLVAAGVSIYMIVRKKKLKL